MSSGHDSCCWILCYQGNHLLIDLLFELRVVVVHESLQYLTLLPAVGVAHSSAVVLFDKLFKISRSSESEQNLIGLSPVPDKT